MILTGSAIAEEVSRGKIKISPYTINNITTNSYDITLGSRFIKYTESILDPAKENSFEIIDANNDGSMFLEKGDFILGHSIEMIGSDYFVPIIHARSGIARMGLFVHVTADLIDIGSYGNITFQLYSTLPVKIYPGTCIAQVSFWKPQGDIILYDGKYQGSKGPQSSRICDDFNRVIG